MDNSQEEQQAICKKIVNNVIGKIKKDYNFISDILNVGNRKQDPDISDLSLLINDELKAYIDNINNEKNDAEARIKVANQEKDIAQAALDAALQKQKELNENIATQVEQIATATQDLENIKKENAKSQIAIKEAEEQKKKLIKDSKYIYKDAYLYLVDLEHKDIQPFNEQFNNLNSDSEEDDEDEDNEEDENDGFVFGNTNSFQQTDPEVEQQVIPEEMDVDIDDI